MPLTERMALDRLDHQDDVETLGRKCTADQRVARLTGLDAGKGRLDRGNAGRLFAHESARRTRDLVHDGDVAGEKVGKLRQKQRRAQLRRQLLVQEPFAVVALQRLVDDERVDIDVALAAAGRDDHVHAAAGFETVLETSVVERQAGSENAETLPVLHLPLVAALRNLLRPVDFRQRVDRIGCETFRFDANPRRLGRAEQRHMRLGADALARHDAYPGDHHIVRGFRHLHFSEPAIAAMSPSSSARLRTISPSGTWSNGIVLSFS